MKQNNDKRNEQRNEQINDIVETNKLIKENNKKLDELIELLKQIITSKQNENRWRL